MFMKGDEMVWIADYLKLLVCFALGAAITTVPGLTGGPELWGLSMMIGAFAGLPALALAALLYVVCQKSILRHPWRWCLSMPVLMTACALAGYYVLAKDEPYLDAFLSGEYLALLVTMTFVGTSAASQLFRVWVLAPKGRVAKPV